MERERERERESRSALIYEGPRQFLRQVYRGSPQPEILHAFAILSLFSVVCNFNQVRGMWCPSSSGTAGRNGGCLSPSAKTPI